MTDVNPVKGRATILTEEDEARFAKLEEESRREYEQRIADKRAATGCYSEDGLYNIRIYKKGTCMIYLSFVDDSSLTVFRDGEIQGCMPCEKCGVTPLRMMEKWLNNGGREYLEKEIAKLTKEAASHAD